MPGLITPAQFFCQNRRHIIRRLTKVSALEPLAEANFILKALHRVNKTQVEALEVNQNKKSFRRFAETSLADDSNTKIIYIYIV